jgi:hypothetical protein
MPYLLDANIFIQAKNHHYGLDFCPAFWDWLIELNEARTVFSIAKVGRELIAGKDELSTWAASRGQVFFLDPPDPGMSPALAEVSGWVVGRSYFPAALNNFLNDAADFYLIGHALAEQFTVVTHEAAAPQAMRKVKIPDVCAGVSVDCISPFEMLRREGARFHLGPSAQRRTGPSATPPTA